MGRWDWHSPLLYTLVLLRVSLSLISGKPPMFSRWSRNVNWPSFLSFLGTSSDFEINDRQLWAVGPPIVCLQLSKREQLHRFPRFLTNSSLFNREFRFLFRNCYLVFSILFLVYQFWERYQCVGEVSENFLIEVRSKGFGGVPPTLPMAMYASQECLTRNWWHTCAVKCNLCTFVLDVPTLCFEFEHVVTSDQDAQVARTLEPLRPAHRGQSSFKRSPSFFYCFSDGKIKMSVEIVDWRGVKALTVKARLESKVWSIP